MESGLEVASPPPMGRMECLEVLQADTGSGEECGEMQAVPTPAGSPAQDILMF